MQLDKTRVTKCLKDFDFKRLFVEELGWDRHSSTLDVAVNNDTYHLSAIAHKRGFVAYTCPLPVKNLRVDEAICKIDTQVAKIAHEHIIIYTDSDRNEQIWQWAKRDQGKPIARRHHHYFTSQSGELLIQKLQTIAFTLEDEENLTVVDVAGRARAAFDLEKVTKKFYERFQKEHAVFLEFLNGIPDAELQRWYASVMLNRLMFIYFIQKKGFLNSDQDYLRNKLLQMQKIGKDRFYKDFLCPLFFEGFAKPTPRGEKIDKFLGNIPYLNGGIFQKHQIEELHGKTIAPPDVAFEKIFCFFDEYDWHLDDRPMRNDNEINPDVLGYIFEKYINQKQMGAYYTKEDITGYISQNTIIPRLFDSTREKCKVAFEGQEVIWKLLKTNPDRYIYDAVKKGVKLELPKNIGAGIADVSKCTEWNKTAPDEYALPTEIWREVVARRQRYEEVKVKLTNGEIKSINDFITYNLDIRQFAQDIIENAEGPELLRAVWHTIVGRIPKKSNEKFEAGISILDPTCGSGAFLFAALNILEPLYEACLERMQLFVDDLSRNNQTNSREKFSDFKDVLDEVKNHPSPKYFIYKSIIINNLFGLDIMEEAIEICKLRLFLKLVAQVDKKEQIEPLPDIDFNIRAGNTLVGFATLDEVKRSMQGDFLKLQELPALEKDAQNAAIAFRVFCCMQTQQNMIAADLAKAKADLKQKLKLLEDQLNGFLAGEYRIDPAKKAKYQSWLVSHKPFHWFVGFYGIICNGGFDVIIGNPPYVEYSKVREEYTILPNQYKTESTGNLYSFVVERCHSLLFKTGCLGLILPLSAFCTQRMTPLIKLVKTYSAAKWIAHFGWRPAKLFEGVNIPLTILLYTSGPKTVKTTTFIKWYSEFRDSLFKTISYVGADKFLTFDHVIPKIGNEIECEILSKLFGQGTLLEQYTTVNNRNRSTLFYRNTGGLYWRIITDFRPHFSQNDQTMASSTESTIEFKENSELHLATAILNSNLYWFFYVVFSSFHHLNPCDILNFPLSFERMDKSVNKELLVAEKALMDDLCKKSEIRIRAHKGGKTSKVQTFFPSQSKSYVDVIDRILSRHYDLSPNELDYIINYDIKYRMADETEDD